MKKSLIRSVVQRDNHFDLHNAFLEKTKYPILQTKLEFWMEVIARGIILFYALVIGTVFLGILIMKVRKIYGW